MSMGNFPEVLSQRISIGIILVARLGVFDCSVCYQCGSFIGEKALELLKINVCSPGKPECASSKGLQTSMIVHQ